MRVCVGDPEKRVTREKSLGAPSHKRKILEGRGGKGRVRPGGKRVTGERKECAGAPQTRSPWREAAPRVEPRAPRSARSPAPPARPENQVKYSRLVTISSSMNNRILLTALRVEPRAPLVHGLARVLRAQRVKYSMLSKHPWLRE